MKAHAMMCAVLLVALTAGCDRKVASAGEYQNVLAFDTARVRLVGKRDTLSLRLELAVSPAQKTLGLMERSTLAEDAGMVFVYDSIQPPDAGFWMYRTRIPLDIAFLDSVGVIRSVRAMTPCPTEIAQGCRTYTPDLPYQLALEVGAGYFAKHGVAIGDSLLLGDLPDSVRRSPRATAAR